MCDRLLDFFRCPIHHRLPGEFARANQFDCFFPRGGVDFDFGRYGFDDRDFVSHNFLS